MFKELSNVTLRIPPGGLCSLELVINGPTSPPPPPPPPTFLYTKVGRGALIGTPATLGSIRVGPVPITKPQSLLMKRGGGQKTTLTLSPPLLSHYVEVCLFHESLECSSLFSALGDLFVLCRVYV